MEKQIEEIKQLARDIYEPKVAIDGIDLAFAAVHGADRDNDTHFMRIARHLHVTKGYRKSEDVAREVIQEAIELARHSADEAKVRADNEANVLLRAELRGQQIGANLILYALAKLKKKYESEDGE